MPEKQLPVSPDINQYKKQAKELVRACRAGVPEALRRVASARAHGKGTKGPRDQGTKKAGARDEGTKGHEVKLAEAQLALAREHGFASWATFAAEIERRRVERAVGEVSDPVDAFLRAALVPRGTAHVSGTLDEAEAIRARYPEVERANIYTAVVLGDAEAVRAWIEGAGPHPSDKNKGVARVGHPDSHSIVTIKDVAGVGSADSHPSDKNKGVARVGHPAASSQFAVHSSQRVSKSASQRAQAPTHSQKARMDGAQRESAATRKGGPYEWEPLLCVCFSRYLRLDKSREEGFERLARMLLEAGADANGGWYEVPDYEGGKPVWESALYGAAGLAQSAGVTRLLLEYGADPNDGETPYHAPEGYDNTVVEILLKSGKLTELSKSWILCRKADWHDYDGMKMCLEYGADPNDVPHWGNSALQHAVQRDNGIEMLRMLLEHGADPLLPNGRDGRNAAQMAARRGRGDFFALLDERGVDAKLTGVDRLVEACARGNWARVEAVVREEPGLREAVIAEGGELLGWFAGVGNTEGVRCLLDLGVRADAVFPGDAYFDEAKESTALHVSAWRGRPEVSRLLIERGAPLDAKDGKGRTAMELAVKACTESYWKGRSTPEWISVLQGTGNREQGTGNRNR